jgi:uncharacterized repeat protein (TIGR03803 family)
MKKLLQKVAFLVAILVFSCLTAAAQGLLWGMTYAGGTNDGGTIFNCSLSGTETVVYSFAGTVANGSQPKSSLIQGTDGNYYGMTNYGGPSNYGKIFKCTNSGVVTILHTFTGGSSDGSNPYYSNLIQASDGNLYGMTSGGGSIGDDGTIFKCTTLGTETILHSFSHTLPDGELPNGSLIQASDGNLYGMTEEGGTTDVGTIFKCTLSGTVTIIHSFAGGASDGAGPYGSLIQGTDGNLYGMTFTGGTGNEGTIFKCTTSGTMTILHSFVGGTDGADPYGSLIQANDGNLYGMTTAGGISGDGTIFKCTTSGTVTTLHSFVGGSSDDGATPYGDLMQASDGNLYGMTTAGCSCGNAGLGEIFQCTLSGTVKTIYSFTGATSDGATPYGGLIQRTITGIQNINNTSDIKIYPNPNSGSFTITLSGTTDKSTVEVYNTMGQEIYTGALDLGSNTIELNSKANGVYLYRVVSENGNLVGQGKLVVQK